MLAEALVEWVEDLDGQIARRPPTGATTADRMVDILRRATRTMEREPRLSEAVIRALSASDPKVIECQQVVGDTMARIQDRAFADGFDEGTRAGIVRALGWIWYAALVGWVTGRNSAAETGQQIEVAVRLLLRD